MLFYSFEFLYVFLPIVVAGYFLITRFLGTQTTIIFLVLASFYFYAQWNVDYVLLLAVSIVINYVLGHVLQGRRSRALLIGGVCFNLGILAYYKYTNFFVTVIGDIAGTGWSMKEIILPLAISFYTFQQIAWLVDSYYQKINKNTEGFWKYALFVSFFPQLIAGPIVHHSEMMPQFSKETTFRISMRSLAIGASIFVIGLVKKVVIADNMASFSTPVFTSAATSTVPLVDAWVASFCFTLQVYFDFSGYSDMAIGLARLFNIRLPMNFNSPLQARSMVDLWGRWHLTMTRFFQAYLYTPLLMYLFRKQTVMNIKGNGAVHLTTFLTFMAIGLWHGANWTFILFGVVHGVFVVVNHLWKHICKTQNWKPLSPILGIFLTFFFFMLSCVIYRAETLHVAYTMYCSMFDFSGHVWSDFLIEKLENVMGASLILLAVVVALFCPSTQQIMQQYNPVVNMSDYTKVATRGWWAKFLWRPNIVWFTIIASFFLWSFNVLYNQDITQEFIYFQF